MSAPIPYHVSGPVDLSKNTSIYSTILLPDIAPTNGAIIQQGTSGLIGSAISKVPGSIIEVTNSGYLQALSPFAEGTILYSDTISHLTALAPSTSRAMLKTQGAGAAPQWELKLSEQSLLLGLSADFSLPSSMTNYTAMPFFHLPPAHLLCFSWHKKGKLGLGG